MHLAHAFGLIAGGGQFSGQGVGVVPADAVLITDPAVVFLAHAGVDRGPRGDAGGGGAVGMGIADPGGGQVVQPGRLYVRMAGDAKTVAAHFVTEDQEDIGSVRHDRKPPFAAIVA